MMLTAYKQQPSSRNECNFQAFGSGSKKNVTDADCNAAMKHIQADKER